MQLIHLTTFVAAPVERVFDLSRHLSVHKFSMSKYKERIISSKTSGLLGLNEDVKWEARHFFKTRTLRVVITALQFPAYLRDEQLEGDFTSMKHEHFFKPADNGTLMIDLFHYELPYGILGRVLNKIYMNKYLSRLLSERNVTIKNIAEGNQWKQYLQS
jgi:ligand-binding SRPBCC domain-containing protein